MTRRSRSRVAVVALTGLVTLSTLAACGGGDDGDAARQTAPGPSPSATTPGTTAAPTTPGATPSATPPAGPPAGPTENAPPFPADTKPDQSGTLGGGGLGVTSVRVARQDGFDRVVFELAGTGTPGWRFSYVTTPVQDGSGAPFTVPGDSFLQVSISGVGYPADTGVPAYAGPKLVTANGTARVQGVAVGSVFEGLFDGAIGISGPPRPFRVFALTGPTRVVVDVRDN
ncbi:MAG: hypothetical protein JWL64_847 [Frankiales bacterium]|nr:hypothetical protein [Frankiales bacterium]